MGMVSPWNKEVIGYHPPPLPEVRQDRPLVEKGGGEGAASESLTVKSEAKRESDIRDNFGQKLTKHKIAEREQKQVANIRGFAVIFKYPIFNPIFKLH